MIEIKNATKTAKKGHIFRKIALWRYYNVGLID